MYILKVLVLVVLLSEAALSVPVGGQQNSGTETQAKTAKGARAADFVKHLLARLKVSRNNEHGQKTEESQPKRQYKWENSYIPQTTSNDAWNTMTDYDTNYYWDDYWWNDNMGGSDTAAYNSYDQYASEGYSSYGNMGGPDPAYYSSSYWGSSGSSDWSPADYGYWDSSADYGYWGSADYGYWEGSGSSDYSYDWYDCDCSDPSFSAYGDYCWGYCGFGNEYPSYYYSSSDYNYYDGSTYDTWSDDEKAYWAFEGIAYEALDDIYCETFGCGYPYDWKRALSQFRRGRRQLQKKELQTDRTDGEDKKPKHARSPNKRKPNPDKTSSNRKQKLDKTPNSQKENNKAQKRYYSTTTPELKSKVQDLFVNYLEKMVDGIVKVVYDPAYSEANVYDPYNSWKRTIEDIKKKKSGLENLKKKIEQKKKEMENKRLVPKNK